VSDVAAAEKWFASKGWAPLEFQREVWRAYLRGESGLVHAATGTGKTLAAWWGPLLEWLARETAGASLVVPNEGDQVWVVAEGRVVLVPRPVR